METLKGLDSLNIREKTKYATPANWKLKPVLCLTDIAHQELYYAVPEKELSLGAEELKQARSFTLYLVNRQGEEILYFEKKFDLFANRVDIFDSVDNPMGSVRKYGASHKRRFQVVGAGGQVLYEIEGGSGAEDIFRILKNDKVVGRISKKFMQGEHEGPSRQDHFGIVFPLEAEVMEKSVLLGALFLIDFLYP